MSVAMTLCVDDLAAYVCLPRDTWALGASDGAAGDPAADDGERERRRARSSDVQQHDDPGRQQLLYLLGQVRYVHTLFHEHNNTRLFLHCV